MEVSRYHRFLRISLLVATFVLVFDSGILFPVTERLSHNTFLYLGSVGAGVFASVPENEINVLTAQISERERTLDAKFETESESDYSTYIISVILFFIIVLLVLNYAFDFARNRKPRYEEQVA